MRKVFFFFLLLVVLFPVAASAQQMQAVVKQFSGKVEVKQPGQDWQPVQVNMTVSAGATVSTGFSSNLVLTLGQSEITVQPLTRMLLQELIKKDVTNVTSLTLRVGRIRAVVKASPGEKNDFTVKGPYATAAVRGTEFTFNVNLNDRAEGVSGHIALISNTTGQATSVGAGMSGAVGDTGRLASPEQLVAKGSSNGFVPSDLVVWTSSHEGGWTLSSSTDNLTSPNAVPPGNNVPASMGLPTITITVN